LVRACVELLSVFPVRFGIPLTLASLATGLAVFKPGRRFR